jgi:hypothetical protein
MGVLSRHSVRSIVRAVADAAARWSDANFPPRMRTLSAIRDRTGYAVPTIEYALDRLFEILTVDALEATIAGELGSCDVLDDFVAGTNGLRQRAIAIGRVCVLSSRTTIGVAIPPAIFALLAKCDVLVKDREDALVAAFFRTLAEELPDFEAAAVAQAWDGEHAPRSLAGLDGVVAFGDDETLSRIRASLQPQTRFIPYGTRSSAGYVSREGLSDNRGALALARGAASDLVLYETEGCLSLHALFVEGGGAITPEQFAELLAREVERAVIEFPLPERAVQTVASLAAMRDLASFRAAQGRGTAYSDPGTTFVVELDAPVAQRPAFLPRAIGVRTVAGPRDVVNYLTLHKISIEALAIAAPRPDVVDMAVEIGAARIARFGELQRPHAQTRHGGRPRIAEFVRWITDECSSA